MHERQNGSFVQLVSPADVGKSATVRLTHLKGRVGPVDTHVCARLDQPLPSALAAHEQQTPGERVWHAILQEVVRFCNHCALECSAFAEQQHEYERSDEDDIENQEFEHGCESL